MCWEEKQASDKFQSFFENLNSPYIFLTYLSGTSNVLCTFDDYKCVLLTSEEVKTNLSFILLTFVSLVRKRKRGLANFCLLVGYVK